MVIVVIDNPPNHKVGSKRLSARRRFRGKTLADHSVCQVTGDATSASGLGRFILLMRKSIVVWQLTLIGGLGLMLLPQAILAEIRGATTARIASLCAQIQPLHQSEQVAAAERTKVRPDLVLVQAPEIRSAPLPDRFPQGSRLMRLAPSDRFCRSVGPPFFAAADPRISFDGTRVLFSAKKTADSRWQVWEMSIDGSDARQITHCPDDCLKPSFLPRGQLVYTVIHLRLRVEPPSRVAQHSPLPPAPARSNAISEIWICNLDGSGAQPLTFGPGDFEVETVLKNGTIVATARSPLLPASGAPADREIYTLRPDGTGLATLRCDHQRPAMRSQVQELDDGSVVFIKASLTSRSVGGYLTWIRRGGLRDEPLPAQPMIASSPQPLAADELLVARTVGGPPIGKPMSVAIFDTGSGRFSTPLDEDAKLSIVEAVSVAPHEPPRWYWSTLNPALQRGYFVCLNSYLADGVPRGRIAGKLTRVRVLILDAINQRERVLGEVPVEEDGSFYIAVPSDKPVRFEVLDAADRVVRAQRSWIWARSGEEHGCVGCHEDRARAPENRWPMALRRFDTPIRLDLQKAVSSRQ